MKFEDLRNAHRLDLQPDLTADEHTLVAISSTLHRLADEASQCGYTDLAERLEETAKAVIGELRDSHRRRIPTRLQGDPRSLH